MSLVKGSYSPHGSIQLALPAPGVTTHTHAESPTTHGHLSHCQNFHGVSDVSSRQSPAAALYLAQTRRLPALLEWLEREGPDVVCLQELKAPDAAFPINDIHAAVPASIAGSATGPT